MTTPFLPVFHPTSPIFNIQPCYLPTCNHSCISLFTHTYSEGYSLNARYTCRQRTSQTIAKSNSPTQSSGYRVNQYNFYQNKKLIYMIKLRSIPVPASLTCLAIGIPIPPRRLSAKNGIIPAYSGPIPSP